MKKRKKISPTEICISHSYSDFDAIASTVAITKLHPDCVAVLNQTTESEVQRFLAIYRDYFQFTHINDIDFSSVQKVFLTDTQSTDNLQPLKEELKKRSIEIIAYDHHPLENNEDITELHVKHYGSVTTFLGKLLQKKNISFNPIEATLFLIGIYEDTGSLTFPSTTPSDLEVAAYFLKNGAKLSIISEFVFPPLQNKQKELFSILLESVSTYSIKGVQIAVAAATYPRYVNGISFLTHRLMDSIDVDALYVIVKIGTKTIVVARSEDETILSVGNIMESIGGGGHPQAGSAFFKNDTKTLDEWTLYILRLTKDNCKVSKLVRDFMSSPVKIVTDTSTAREALMVMLRYGHSGLPVTNSQNKLIGIISRKDIERITDEKLLRRSVKAYMTKHVIWVSPETPLKNAEKLIVDKNIGRLPVIFEHTIVGILTRSDLLRALYGISRTSSKPKHHVIPSPNRIEVNQLLDDYLPSEHLRLIRQIGRVSDKNEQRAFLVGGCVRDLFLNKPCKDYDFLIDGDAIQIADELQKTIRCKIIKNPEFHTAKLLTHSTEMDLASTRTEYYEQPAALPTVTSGSLREDLFRRDFTINAMALSLEPKRFGTVIDYYHGYDDLKHQKIRILHNLSFLEDPSRIFRAVLYSLRYNFVIEEQSKESALHAMDSGLFNNTSRHRILSSFIRLLSEPIDVVLAFKQLKELHALQLISEDIVLTSHHMNALRKAKIVLQQNNIGPQWVVYVSIITISLPWDQTHEICTRLRMNNKMIATIRRIHYASKELDYQLEKEVRNSQIYSLLKQYTQTELCAFLCLLSFQSRKKILFFLDSLRKTELLLTAREIEELTGLKRKELGKCIQQLKMVKLDGFVQTKEDEMTYLRVHFPPKGVNL